MPSPAKVTSIEAVREFRSVLLTFEQEATSSLESMQMLLHRVIAWIEQECPAYWDSQVKRAFDKVTETRTRLTTCQMRTVAGRHPTCIEEKQDYERARRRLQHCQEMVQRVKRSGVKLRHEIDEFRGRTAGLARSIETDLPAMAALIGRMASALEAYAERPSDVADAALSSPPPPAAVVAGESASASRTHPSKPSSSG